MSLSAQVSTLANQIAAFTTKESASKEAAMVANITYIGEGVGVEQEQCQYLNNRNFNYCLNYLPTHYHPGLRNHEIFSYANQRNALQPPPGFQQPVAEKKSSIEDLLSTFIVETRGRFNKSEARIDSIETYYTNMSAFIKSLEVQMGQLAIELKSQKERKFPRDTEHNPREQCQAIMLRSRKEVESPKPRKFQSEKIEKKAEVQKEPPKAAQELIPSLSRITHR